MKPGAQNTWPSLFFLLAKKFFPHASTLVKSPCHFPLRHTFLARSSLSLVAQCSTPNSARIVLLPTLTARRPPFLLAGCVRNCFVLCPIFPVHSLLSPFLMPTCNMSPLRSRVFNNMGALVFPLPCDNQTSSEDERDGWWSQKRTWRSSGFSDHPETQVVVKGRQTTDLMTVE